MLKYQFYKWDESISMYDKNAKWIIIILKESLWKIERERLKWHLAHKSIIGNNNWLTAYDIHMYIYYTGQLMTVFSNNYINYIFFYLWKILFFGPLENSNLFNLHGKITGPQHTYTNFQKLSKRILDPLLLINSDYLLMDLLTIKNRPWVKDSSINCTSNSQNCDQIWSVL